MKIGSSESAEQPRRDSTKCCVERLRDASKRFERVVLVVGNEAALSGVRVKQMIDRTQRVRRRVDFAEREVRLDAVVVGEAFVAEQGLKSGDVLGRDRRRLRFGEKSVEVGAIRSQLDGALQLGSRRVDESRFGECIAEIGPDVGERRIDVDRSPERRDRFVQPAAFPEELAVGGVDLCRARALREEPFVMRNRLREAFAFDERSRQIVACVGIVGSDRKRALKARESFVEPVQGPKNRASIIERLRQARVERERSV